MTYKLSDKVLCHLHGKTCLTFNLFIKLIQYTDILAYKHYLRCKFLKLTIGYMGTQLHKKSYFKRRKKTLLLDPRIITSWPLLLCKIGRKSLEWIQGYENTRFLGPKWSIWPKHKFFQKNH